MESVGDSSEYTNPHGLNPYAKNVTSQYGEDGVIETALDTLENVCGWCVEFGAWDGKHLSNTHHLIVNKGFSAVLIEGDKNRYRELQRSFAGYDHVIPVNNYVGFKAHDGLDSILAGTEIPPDFDVLSIDIDGNDYHVWDALRVYRPKIVVVEFNPTIPTCVEFVQAKDMSVSQGSSLLSLVTLGRTKGYELVATTRINAVFVDQQYYARFGIEDNSPSTLRVDESLITHLFQGFDGTLFVRGNRQLLWHGIEFDSSRLQLLPAWLRQYPSQLSRWQRRALKWYQKRRRRDAA